MPPSDTPGAAETCSDCPPVGYPTDATRCLPCPRRGAPQNVLTPGAAEIEAAKLAGLTPEYVAGICSIARRNPNAPLCHAVLRFVATITTLTAERDEAIGNAQHAIHQAEALAARVAKLEALARRLRPVAMAWAQHDPEGAAAIAADIDAALAPRDGGGDDQS